MEARLTLALSRRGLALGVLFGTLACAASPMADRGSGGRGGSNGGNGGAGPSGSGGAGAVGGPGGAIVIGPSGLPVRPGPADVPRPTGTAGNLRVIDWAGFASALTYTFDDAQPSQIEHYADLQAAGVPLTFFITSGSNTASAGFDATFTQAVRDGHEMGNHTVHHCYANLTGCANGSSTNVETELDDCNSYIAGHFGQAQVWTAASPYGDTGYDAIDMSRFFLNRGVAGGTIAPRDGTDPFNLPCHAAVAGETAASFNSVIDSSHTAGRWVIMLIHTLNPTAANWYAPIDVTVVTDSIAHARSLGDVWIDSMASVGAYWRGQKIVAAAVPTAAGGGQTMTWTWTLPAHFPGGRYLRVTVDGGSLSQAGQPLDWDGRGYYEIALDAGTLTLSP